MLGEVEWSALTPQMPLGMDGDEATFKYQWGIIFKYNIVVFTCNL